MGKSIYCLVFPYLSPARVSRADRLEPSSVSSSHKNQIRRRAHDVQSALHCFFVGHCRSRGLIADRSCSREGPGPKAPHPFRIIGEKACAVVRMVDEDPEGRRARDEPRAQLGPLGQPVRPAGRRSGGLASPCRPHYRANTASGEWIVRSGNDGGRVRERPRSVAGAVFRI